MESLEFFSDIILRVIRGLGVERASNRNEHQEYFFRTGVGKGSRCLGLTNLPLPSADFLEILGASVS
jgi:hypothetical protein